MDVTSASSAGSFIQRKGASYMQCVKGWLGPAAEAGHSRKASSWV